MLCFISKCFTSCIKDISDTIITIICTITSLTGSVLILAKYYNIKFIDDKISWTEATLPIIVGTGGCIIYRVVCYGLESLLCYRKNDDTIKMIELV